LLAREINLVAALKKVFGFLRKESPPRPARDEADDAESSAAGEPAIVEPMKTYFQGLRSPREKLAGWVHLPRFIDKIRLHQAGKLPADYQANFCQGFDGMWLAAAGVDREEFLEVARRGASDAEIEQWVIASVNSRVTPEQIEAFNQRVLNRGRGDELAARLAQRKAESGLSQRDDIQTFVDYIDADEGRS
jgi:gluconokinase